MLISLSVAPSYPIWSCSHNFKLTERCKVNPWGCSVIFPEEHSLFLALKSNFNSNKATGKLQKIADVLIVINVLHWDRSLIWWIFSCLNSKILLPKKKVFQYVLSLILIKLWLLYLNWFHEGNNVWKSLTFCNIWKAKSVYCITVTHSITVEWCTYGIFFFSSEASTVKNKSIMDQNYVFKITKN